MRRTETEKDYKSLTDKAIKWYIESNFKQLQKVLQDLDRLDRSKQIKISIALNNLLRNLNS